MFTSEDLLRGNEGRISIVGAARPAPGLEFRSAQYDLGRSGRGDLYVAVEQEGDGHGGIPAAAAAGAAGVLCTAPHPEAPPDLPQFVVPDVVKALQATARVRVRRQPGTIKVAVTGTNGKTTTKEAVAAVLRTAGPTLATHGNHNDEIEYPLTLLRLRVDERYAVLEMGAEWVGELRGHCESVTPPDWSVITTVGPAHLAHFGSLENVAIAKSELVQALSERGLAVLNRDDPAVRSMAGKTRARVMYYGVDPGADVRATDVRSRGLFGTCFTLCVAGRRRAVRLSLLGRHGVTTALAATAVGHAAGVPLALMCDALEALVPVRGRGEVRMGAGPGGSCLIDDTYNSNRQAVVAMTRALRATPAPATARRWAVLGEMLDLGRYSQEEHRLTGAALSGACDRLVAIGDDARHLLEGARDAGMPEEDTHYFPARPSHEAEVAEAKRQAMALLEQRVGRDDLVLVKGSRGMRMETMLPGGG
jgi:UDP-N-acetylmuramoyl-tripeptide--D-alanyl-D-alanine ligase